MPYPLHPSPITLLRTKYGRSAAEAAHALELSEDELADLEMRTAEVPPMLLAAIEVLLAPSSRFTQVTIWEALAELDQDGGGQGGAHDA